MQNEIIPILFGGKIATNLFKFRCDLVDYEKEWEIEYVSDLINTLEKGMTVYDIGAENGELSVLAANIVGGNNVHIFEPNINYFPNIKAIWDANNLDLPAICFNGYVSDISSNNAELNNLYNLGIGNIFYGCLHPNHIDTPMPTISLNDYCKYCKAPDVVMMDIEGAELLVVKGAIDVIKEYAPIFFISIHKPQFILHQSNGTKEDLIKIFIDNNYEAIHLATDHEEHWKFKLVIC